MVKRRRGNHQAFIDAFGHHRTTQRTHYQVPTLRTLAANQVRRNDPHWRSNTRSHSHFIHSMDTNMSGTGTDARTQTVNTGPQQGASEAGKGLQVTNPPRQVPHIWNNNYTVRLTYCDTIRKDVSYGAGTGHVFATNSIFDPDVTSTGHQPLGRDLWASMYDYYTVLECEYEIHCYNAARNLITYTSIGTAPQNLATVLVSLNKTTNVNDFVNSGAITPIGEMKNVETQFLPPEMECVFRGKVTPGDYIVDAKDADSDNTWVAQGSNPGVLRYLGYVISPAQTGSLGGQNMQFFAAVQTYVKLNYTVQFTQINASLRESAS